jgi:hypothetical protein
MDNANDSSGTGNNWTATNIVAGDYMLDSPTNNYATLNPLAPSGGTFSNGNLSWASATTDGRFALSTISPSTDGKWYCEVNIGSKASTYWTVGLFSYPATALPRILYRSDGPIYLDGSEVATVSSFTQNDVIGMAYDGSTRSLTLYKNNTSLGSWTASSTTINYFFGCASDSSGSSANYTLNFGQSGFTYTPPAGFLALSTANLPEPSISPADDASPQDHFNTVLWTGTNTNAGNSVTSVGFKPDLVWAKIRSQAYSPLLYDSIRGTGATAELKSDGTEAEGGSSSSERGFLNSFDTNGFSSVIGSAGDNLYFNQASETYVAWNWKASNATAVSNTEGTITSQVSANTTAGFSIVSYTGTFVAATVGHGLSSAPELIIVKNRSITSNWWVGSDALGGWDKYLGLNLTNAVGTATSIWDGTAPTSTVFSVADDGGSNGSGNSIIAYCFNSVEGYSKFGSYTGNGSADGPFVYTGFRPAWVMVKGSSLISEWYVWDAIRNTYNVTNLTLNPNQSVAEYSGGSLLLDLTANGFKLRDAVGSWNLSGNTYIYMAFASNPFKYANAR